MNALNTIAQDDSIRGEITHIIFQSDDEGFCILKILDAQQCSATITGYCAHPQVGQIVQAVGHWAETAHYGKQFKAAQITVEPPKSKAAILQYLCAGSIRGIGPQLAKQLVNTFGIDTLDVITDTPEKLLQIEGIGKKKLASICQSWETQQSFAEVGLFLQSHGIGPARAVKIHKRYGADTIAIIQKNPYRLYQEISGIGFLIADKIAQSLGIMPTDENRLNNAICYVMQEHCSQGHSKIPLSYLLSECERLLTVNADIIKAQLTSGSSDIENQIVIISAEKAEAEPFYALKSIYHAEQYIAEKLHSLCQHPGHIPDKNKLDTQIATLPTVLGYHLSSSQKSALNTIFNHKVCIMTGGPGVGKTTLIQSIVYILKKNHTIFTLCAPTGRAAKRLKEATGHNAKTIHRALNVDPISRQFQHNEKNQLNTEYCIIDEASMLDINITRHMLAALPKHCGLLLVGDIDQLPSVGAGNILNDLIQSQRIPVVALTEIFRQAQTSQIIQYSHAVRQGKIPCFHEKKTNQTLDSYAIFSSDVEGILEKINYMVSRRIPEKFQVNPMQDIQILCPMIKGALGTYALNRNIQSLLNPNGAIIKYYSHEYRVGDRVMQNRNNYDKDVFNGDIGYIHQHDSERQRVNIRFDDRTVEYLYEELEEITLAYAMTIHKSQGSEFSVVIMPVFSGHYIMLERNLIYTGMTRARKLLILIGDKKSLILGINKQSAKSRQTHLQETFEKIFSD